MFVVGGLFVVVGVNMELVRVVVSFLLWDLFFSSDFLVWGRAPCLFEMLPRKAFEPL